MLERGMRLDPIPQTIFLHNLKKMRDVVDFVDLTMIIHFFLNILDIAEVETPTCRATSAKGTP